MTDFTVVHVPTFRVAAFTSITYLMRSGISTLLMMRDVNSPAPVVEE